MDMTFTTVCTRLHTLPRLIFLHTAPKLFRIWKKSKVKTNHILYHIFSSRVDSGTLPKTASTVLSPARLAQTNFLKTQALNRSTSTHPVATRESPTKVYTRAVSTLSTNRNSIGSDQSQSSGEEKSPRNSAIGGGGGTRIGIGRRDSTSSSKSEVQLRDSQVIELNQQVRYSSLFQLPKKIEKRPGPVFFSSVPKPGLKTNRA